MSTPDITSMSRRRAWFILWLALAVLSVVGGYVGLPGWTGVRTRFDRFLEPVLRLPEAAHEAAVHTAGQELLFTGLSVVISLFGIFMAYRFYVVNPGIPERIAGRIQGVYRWFTISTTSMNCTMLVCQSHQGSGQRLFLCRLQVRRRRRQRHRGHHAGNGDGVADLRQIRRGWIGQSGGMDQHGAEPAATAFRREWCSAMCSARSSVSWFSS